MSELAKTAKAENARNATSSPSNGVQDRFVTPRGTVYESSDAVVVELEMPGVGKDNVEITIDKDELSIVGRRSRPADEGFDIIHQERLLLPFHRTYVLSERIDTSAISAHFENGVLKLTLPKSAEAKPRKIAIA